MKTNLILLVFVLLIFCGGCQNAGLKDTVDQQQQSINDLEARVKTMEMRLNQTQQDMAAMKKKFTKIKEDVKKLLPGYVEGNIQEGGH